MYPRDKSCKYARRGANSAVYILIIPGKINYGEKKRKKTQLFLCHALGKREPINDLVLSCSR